MKTGHISFSGYENNGGLSLRSTEDGTGNMEADDRLRALCAVGREGVYFGRIEIFPVANLLRRARLGENDGMP